MDTLTMSDRGDCCPAQARVLIGKDELRLMLCLHHFNKYSNALLAGDWYIMLDDRDGLLAKPVGAEVR